MGRVCYFCFRVDFSHKRTETTHAFLHALPTSQYERGRSESCLHCEPDLRFITVIQLHHRDNSWLALYTLFCPLNRSKLTLLRTVMISTHRWTYFSSTRLDHNSTRKRKKCFETERKPHLVYCKLSREDVQEEGSERQRELQEPQGVSEQREDGQRSGRRRSSVLRTGLSQQTIHQQQRGVLWHRLQGELTA